MVDGSVAASQVVAGKLSDLTTKSADLPAKPNQVKPVQAVPRCRTLCRFGTQLGEKWELRVVAKSRRSTTRRLAVFR
jgi:hypothetical protein